MNFIQLFKVIVSSILIVNYESEVMKMHEVDSIWIAMISKLQ